MAFQLTDWLSRSSSRAFSLSTRNVSAVVANLHATDQRLQSAARRIVRRTAEAHYGALQEAVPVRTGFMYAHIRLRFTEQRLGYETGWDHDDFTAADLAFYPPYVIFGTRFQAPNDFFFPLRDEYHAQLRADLRTELRRAIRRRAA